MTQPFDKIDLVNRFKSEGLPVTEDAIQLATKIFMEWLGDSCAIHENPLVKAGGVLVATLKPVVLDIEDRIDGQIGR